MNPSLPDSRAWAPSPLNRPPGTTGTKAGAWVHSLTSWDLRHLWARFPTCDKGVPSLLPSAWEANRDPSLARPKCGQAWTVPRSHMPPNNTCMWSQPRAPVSHKHHKASARTAASSPRPSPAPSHLVTSGQTEGDEVRWAGSSKQVHGGCRAQVDSRGRSPSYRNQGQQPARWVCGAGDPGWDSPQELRKVSTALPRSSSPSHR